MLPLLLAALLQSASPPPLAPTPRPAPPARTWPTHEADFIVHGFRFRSGETLPEVHIHYTTLGQPHRNAKGEIDNAVMVLHGTGGTGKQFLVSQFAGELYGPGQPLDIRKYWIILPDNVGHGGSSKPSDGLHMRFPHYDYADMVELQHRLLANGLGLKHARLIMGTSMGCMHSFLWGEMYPDFPQALMPLACEPIAIAGLNRMWRQMLIDGIEADPAWANGEYKVEPQQGLRTAASILVIAGSAPLNFQATWPDRDAAAAEARKRVSRYIAEDDANDMIYQFDSSRTYNPWPELEKIKAPLTWINSADDFINARNLPYPADAIRRMPHARFRLIPETSDTHGHGTHTWAINWKTDLADLLARSGG
jgi:homoserine O-acetyltransferase/O-succinyltransferase